MAYFISHAIWIKHLTNDMVNELVVNNALSLHFFTWHMLNRIMSAKNQINMSTWRIVLRNKERSNLTKVWQFVLNYCWKQKCTAARPVQRTGRVIIPIQASGQDLGIEDRLELAHLAKCSDRVILILIFSFLFKVLWFLYCHLFLRCLHQLRFISCWQITQQLLTTN